MADLGHLNGLNAEEARAAFLRCCGSSRWALAMAERRPFASAASIMAAADEIGSQLSREDWLEAFAAHPRIGDLDALRKKFASTAAWCAGEQSGVAGAGDVVLQALAEGNRRYEERFGYLFIVCAAGKAAAEMLEILQERLKNSAETEFAIATREQAKITRLRLEKQ